MAPKCIQRHQLIPTLLLLAFPLVVRADTTWVEEVSTTNLPSRANAQSECKTDEFYKGYAEGYLQANSMRGQAELVTDNVRFPGLSPFVEQMLDSKASATSVEAVLGKLHESVDTLCARALKPYLEISADKKATFRSGDFQKAQKNFHCCRSGYQDAREKILARMMKEPAAQTCAKVYNQAIINGIYACYTGPNQFTSSGSSSLMNYILPSACAASSMQSCGAPPPFINPMFKFKYKDELKAISQQMKEWFDPALADDAFAGLKPELRSCFTWGIGQARLKCKEAADAVEQTSPDIAIFIAPASKSQQTIQKPTATQKAAPASTGDSGI
jgi:hypothetical protein